MNATLQLNYSQFINSPSRKDGISEHVEKYLRSNTCQFIDEFGKSYELGGKVRLLACSILHTFYLRVSFQEIPRFESAVACLIIAGKIEGKVTRIKKFIRSAGEYLMKHFNFKNNIKNINNNNNNNQAALHFISQQELFHWMSSIHIRERQITERLQGELRTVLPVHHMKITDLNAIIVDKTGTKLRPKNKYISDIFRGSFEIMRKICRSVICIFYPPPWLCAVSIFKSLRMYNKQRLINNNNQKVPPKLYLIHNWYIKYDPFYNNNTGTVQSNLNLNIIQYLSSEVDSCDPDTKSFIDYTIKPAELGGIIDLAKQKRINLIRTTKFQKLPQPIKNEIRHAFKLKNNEFIDLRADIIIKQQFDDQKDDNDNDNSSWLIGKEPAQMRKLLSLIYRNQIKQKKIQKKKVKSHQELEEGELIEDDNDKYVISNQKYKYRNRNNNNNRYNNRYYRNNNNRNKNQNKWNNRNSNKNFETNTLKEQKKQQTNMNNGYNYDFDDDFHKGNETHKFVLKSNQNNNNNNSNSNYSNSNNNIIPFINCDSDNYFMNWNIQRFQYETNGECFKRSPEPQENILIDNGSSLVIPTPNFTITGLTPQSQYGGNGITPNYFNYNSPQSPDYNNNNNNNTSHNNNNNNNNKRRYNQTNTLSFTTNHRNEPPRKKLKHANHSR